MHQNSFVRIYNLLTSSRNSPPPPHFTEPEGSLPYSQQPVTSPCSMTNNQVHAFPPKFFKMHSGFPTKVLYIYFSPPPQAPYAPPTSSSITPRPTCSYLTNDRVLKRDRDDPSKRLYLHNELEGSDSHNICYLTQHTTMKREAVSFYETFGLSFFLINNQTH
jgi:hypothetical protein